MRSMIPFALSTDPLAHPIVFVTTHEYLEDIGDHVPWPVARLHWYTCMVNALLQQ